MELHQVLTGRKREINWYLPEHDQSDRQCNHKAFKITYNNKYSTWVRFFLTFLIYCKMVWFNTFKKESTVSDLVKYDEKLGLKSTVNVVVIKLWWSRLKFLISQRKDCKRRLLFSLPLRWYRGCPLPGFLRRSFLWLPVFPLRSRILPCLPEVLLCDE